MTGIGVRMRFVLWGVALVLVIAVGYVAVAGFVLARIATGILTVGTIPAALDAAPRPADPQDVGWRGTPEQAFGLAIESVVIETPLGQAESSLVPAKGLEVGRAIHDHGIAGAREDGYRHLPLLHAAGWSVLLIRYRNDASAPASTDNLDGFGLTERPDLAAAVDLFAPRPQTSGVLLVAESMGGAILGQFLTYSANAAAVTAAARDSPGLSLSAVLDHLARSGNRPLPGAGAETAGVYATFPGPLLIAHGSGDRIVPIAPAQAMAAARNGPTTTLWTGANQQGSHPEDSDA
jgi:hypothetical protein